MVALWRRRQEADVFVSDLLKNRRILVTGGGTGLGKEMTAHFLRLGAELYICGRRGVVLEETANGLMSELGGSVKCLVVDIRNPKAVEDMVAGIFADGPLDGLVNNAAGNFISPTKDLSSGGFDAITNIVLHGTFYVTHAVGRRWIAGGHKGSILSILTPWVITGSPFVVPSAMAKAGVHIMTKSLAVEWGRYGIRVNAVAPGPFPTPGTHARLRPRAAQRTDSEEENFNPLGRTGRMGELTNLACFLMSEGCDYLTGETIVLDGGQHLVNQMSYPNLMSLTDEDWARVRAEIRAASDAEKKDRSV
jgi:NAD(P)-dependent dehydrogenase (short-subunit alcohol dehydrogenase family)